MACDIKNIPPDADLLALLAEDCWKKAAEMGMNTADMVIFLPNRRACQRFAKLWSGTFVPMLVPLGEWDEVWLYQQAMRYGPEAAESLLAVPKAADPLQCQLQLADALYEAQGDLFPRRHTLEQLLPMVQSIWQVFERIEREGQVIDRLLQLDAIFLSEQWRDRVMVLQFATRWWINQRKAKQVTTPTDRRNRLAEWLALQWKKYLPETPVIIAGSTGSQSSTMTLMQAAKNLSDAEIWLPGWDAMAVDVSSNHPSFSLQQLLSLLEMRPASHISADERSNALHAAFRSHRPMPIPEGITRLDVRDEEEEAQMIALLVREALQEAEGYIAIVTNDAARIRRIQSVLQRHHITADSAVGQPILSHSQIQFWCLLLQLAAAPHSATSWLALMKHACCLQQQPGWRALVEQLEVKCLRGYTAQGDVLEALHFQAMKAEWGNEWQRFYEAVQAWLTIAAQKSVSAIQRYEAQRACWQALQDSIHPDAHGAIERLKPLLTGARAMDHGSYQQLMMHLLGQQKYFPLIDAHPRVAIYSPIEARLMQAERMILAGLNESDWPDNQLQEAWLHPLIADSMGLVSSDAMVGLSAHDFVSLSAAAKDVFWVRAQRTDGAEQLPSRWLERFDTSQAQPRYLDWLRYNVYDEPLKTVEPPCAQPPADARPAEFSISAIEQLLRDPYGYYAKYILGLRKLDPLDQLPDAALRGQLVHRVMEAWNEALNNDEPITRDTFLNVANRVIDAEPSLLVRLQWAPRIQAMADTIAAIELERRSTNDVESEQTMYITLGAATLNGRADRLEYSNDSVTVIDYKVGTPPTGKDVERGFAAQLPLLGLMAHQQDDKEVRELAYWQLAAVADPVRMKPVKLETEAVVSFYRDGITKLMDYYAQPGSAYFAIPQPAMKPFWNDYAHFSREKAWLEDAA